ncbi:PAS domain-containing protein [Belliella sp. R4-6]|uniref:histidine kinase n=1 Tax=Belliella alkalica TaxID=1730871 RepID=A0ABS9V6P2_9BACT|nr:PAS domain-containing protein [Belliella alkalica]MCH7412083.1 PAS domain-containing protein [Belliella alkalica]
MKIINDKIFPKFLEHSNSYLVVLTDTNGKILFINNKVKSVFGSDEEVIKNSISPSIAVADEESSLNGFIKQCLEDPTKTYENVVETMDSEAKCQIWIKWEISPIMDEEQVIAISFLGRDISESYRKSDDLTQQDIFLQSIYDNANTAYTCVDKDLKIVFNNKKAKEITKSLFGKEAEIGDTCIDFYLEDFRSEFKCIFSKVLTGESIILEKFDGENWWKFVFKPVINGLGEVIGVSKSVSDISDQKHKESIILETKNKYQNLIENSPGIIFSISNDGVFQFVSESIESILGFKVDEIENKLFSQFIHPKDAQDCFEIIKNIYKTKQKVSGVKFRALHKNGNYKWLIANGGPVTNKDNKTVIATATAIEIDELIQREMKILRQNEALKKIAWNQSHIVRKPVANILGLCGLLKDENKSNLEIELLIDLIRESVEELDKVIHENVSLSEDNQKENHFPI